MRLIDADALEQVKFHGYPEIEITPSDVDVEAYKRGWNDAVDAIMGCAPTIEPPEVLVAKITVTKDQLQEAIKKAIADMEPESYWIPVTEELPEEDGEYLVTKENDWQTGVCVDIARWYKSDHENNGFHKANRVIAWMPLPEPYKG